MERLLSNKEVADLLQTTTKMVGHLVRNGELRSINIGSKKRFDPRDVQEYVDNLRNKESTPFIGKDSFDKPLLISTNQAMEDLRDSA